MSISPAALNPSTTRAYVQGCVSQGGPERAGESEAESVSKPVSSPGRLGGPGCLQEGSLAVHQEH